MKTKNKYRSGLHAYCPKHKKVTEITLEFDCDYWSSELSSSHEGRVIVYCHVGKKHRLFEIGEFDEFNA